MNKVSATTQKRIVGVSLILARLSAGDSLSTAVCSTRKTMAQSEDGPPPSRSTLFRWYQLYVKNGWSRLATSRQKPRFCALSEKFLSFLALQKKADSAASIPEIIRRARQEGVIPKDQPIDRTTVYRHAVKLNLPLMRSKRQENTARPFAYKHRMQMVLCDGKHFRAGSRKVKRVAFFYLDDATRYVLDVIVGSSETAELFLRGLHDAIAMHGLMQCLYLDRGSAFTSDAAAIVAANLDVTFIHGKARYPQGHGKIERFNRTALAQCLRGLDTPEVNPSMTSLRERIRHFIRNQYVHTSHESLGATPHEVFTSDKRPLDFPASAELLASAFILNERRKVRNDNVLSVHDTLYEVPFGYSGTSVSVFLNILTGEVRMVHEGRSITLTPPNLHANAREKRQPIQKTEATTGSPPVTATERSWRKITKPLVNRDGGFSHEGDE